jgi:broad specificity phosphatase PhoE
MQIDQRLAEVSRPRHWYADYHERALRYVAGQPYQGWEAHEAAARRLDAAVQDGLRARGDAPLVIVGHGLALTLWLQSAGAVPGVAAFWQAMTFPDAWRISVQPNGASLLATAATRIAV